MNATAMRRHCWAWLLVAETAVSGCSTRTLRESDPQPETSYQMLVPKGVLRYTLEPGATAVQPLPDKQAAPA